VEIKGAVLLYTLAGLMVTFAGFSTLVVSIRQAGGAKLSALDKFLAKTVLTHLILLTGGALLPPLLALYNVPEGWIWRIAAVLLAVPLLALLLTYSRRRRKAVGEGPPPSVFAIFVVFGSAVLVAMLVYVLAGFAHAAAAYATALIANFFTCAFAFVVAFDIIIQHPGTAPPQ
jgi:hypothetical protein